MTNSRRAVVFVTEELFLPRPHNGSADVYLRSAQDYAHQGYEVFCISFFRDPQQASDAGVRESYAALFRDFLLLPGWNGGGTLRGRISLAWREISRWVTGNIFAKNRMLTSLLTPHLRDVLHFVREHDIGTIFFHKPHTVLLLADILPLVKPAHLIVDLHDDFVERELHYRRAYSAFFADLSGMEIAKDYGKQYLRHRFSRIDTKRSRDVETRLLAQCDQVLFSSLEEYRRYLSRPQLEGKLVHKPRKFAPAHRLLSRRSPAPFDAGFIGSDDVMNLDGLMWFCREIMPQVLQRRPDFRFLVAGSIRDKARHLLRDYPTITIWPSLDDVGSFYEAIDMLVVPLRYGTGTSTKVHEALAFGWPIVSTTVGVRGIPDGERIGVAVTDQAGAFAAAVVARLVDQNCAMPAAVPQAAMAEAWNS